MTTITIEQALTLVALDYAEGAYEGSGERMARALHSDLAKRAVFANHETGADFLHQMNKTELVSYAADGHGKQPENHRQRDVKILDVFGDAAVVRLEMNDWVDYLQLAHMDGQWLIVNVLWELKNKP